MNSAQTHLQGVLDGLVNDGTERGLQLAVYKDGELIIDAWSGFADEAREKPVDGRTLFPVFSCTKGVFSTVMHRLVERGLLDYDKPVAEVWPEYGCNGKEGITLRHIMTHSAGVPQIPEGLNPEALADWDRTCAALAQVAPMWEPGTAQNYHALTMGYLMGEIARRVTGLMPGALVQREIVEPAKIEDMYLGLPASEDDRVAWLEEIGPEPAEDAGTPAVPRWLMPLHRWMNMPESRRIPNPASNGIMSARALARHYAALAPGGIDGVELLTPERVKIATERYLINGDPEQSGGFGLGYGVSTGNGQFGPEIATFGHGGYGGSQGFGAPSERIGVGFARNRLRNVDSEVDTVGTIYAALREALGFG